MDGLLQWPIVSRATRKVRLLIGRTEHGNPCIREFDAYNDTSTGREGDK